ncbi:hypothetical protein [Actinomadura rugatobispora]|uniref:RHIM domain-containing protein n=1 Tax=Actinomadura rugatobispora TaxID=1994 RepID=A0ABW1A392_9ACTN|nr:hypothetical protein GCM10010200_029560 [Actinomadura rugatobispora]
MADPLTLAIAAAAAGKAVELTGQPVKDGILALGRKVRGRFRGRPDDEEALSGAIADPGDDARIARLAEVLRRVMEEDPGFADDLEEARLRAMEEDPRFRTEVHNRLSQTRSETTVADDGVSIVFNGSADKSIQVRDVHGGLTIN